MPERGGRSAPSAGGSRARTRRRSALTRRRAVRAGAPAAALAAALVAGGPLVGLAETLSGRDSRQISGARSPRRAATDLELPPRGHGRHSSEPYRQPRCSDAVAKRMPGEQVEGAPVGHLVDAAQTAWHRAERLGKRRTSAAGSPVMPSALSRSPTRKACRAGAAGSDRIRRDGRDARGRGFHRLGL